MDISIIICTTYKEKSIFELFHSLINQINIDLFKPEIIVVDNNQIEENLDLKNLCNSFNLIYAYEKNPGLTSARHRGIRMSSGRILTFIDDDVVLPLDWLSNILESEQKENWKLAGGPSLPIFTSALPRWLNAFIEKPALGGWVCPWLSIADLGVNEVYVSPLYIWGLNFSIKRELVLELSGFNPDLMPENNQKFIGDGESGLAKKIINRNIRGYYSRGLLVFHKCPRERLTLKYFINRTVYNAYGDCFSDLRNLKNKNFNWFIYLFLRFISRVILIFLRTNLFASSSNGKIFRTLLKMLYYYRYYEYLNFYRVDNDLKNWVHRVDFFDSKPI